MNYKFCVIIADRGDRPEFLNHCLMQMDRQTVRPDTIYLIDYEPKNEKVDIIPRIKEGIRKAREDGFEYCYIIENDDYYPDDYFENMPFKGYDFVGIGKTIYYSINRKMFSMIRHLNRVHSSLFCTGFRISAIGDYKWPADDFMFLDLHLWKFIIKRKNFHLYEPENMPIGMKHGIGLCVTDAHKKEHKYDNQDKNLQWLGSHVRKESFKFYKSLISKKILVANHHLEKLGGSETFTYTLTGELVRSGHEIDLFTFHPGFVSDRIKQDFNVNIQIRDSYDLILASHNTTVNHLKGRGFIIQTCHGIYPDLEQPSPYADFHVAISKEVKDHLKSLGFDSEIIWNGIDCERFSPVIRKYRTTELKTVLSLSKNEKANEMIRQACQVAGIDFISRVKNKVWDIEKDINNADLVISLGRGVYEAMACGRPVVIFDNRSYSGNYADGIITKENISGIMENNCSGRHFRMRFTARDLVEEFKKYDPAINGFLRDFAVKNLNIKTQTKKYLEIYENRS